MSESNDLTREQVVTICKVMAKACMWGQGGIASVILQDLDRAMPQEGDGWQKTYQDNAKQAKREAVGVLDDEARLKSYLSRGYWITNFDEDGASLFNPPPMNGLAMYVAKELAEPYRKRERTHTATSPYPVNWPNSIL